MRQFRQPAQVDALHRLVVVEVHEGHLAGPQHVAQARGGDQVLDVAPVARPLGDDHLGGSLAAAQLDDGRHHARVGVDHLVAVILDQVRLQDDSLALQGHLAAEGLVLPADDVGEVGVVITDGGDVDGRLRLDRAQHLQGPHLEAQHGGAEAVAEAPAAGLAGRRGRHRTLRPGQCERAAPVRATPARRQV